MYITKSDPQLSRPRRLLQNLLAYVLYSIFKKNANKNYFLFVKQKEEMKKMTIIEPYDDEEMVYDKENHRYKLTQAGAKKVPYTTSFYGSEIDFYLDDMSETVYQYIYDVANKIMFHTSSFV